MTASSARAHQLRSKSRGDESFHVRLTPPAAQSLTELSEFYRLTKREVIERLVLGTPLGGGGGGNEQQRLGMSDPEYRAFVIQRDACTITSERGSS